MYLWIGCKLPADFENAIRSHCLTLNETIGLSTAPFALPQHISLKISFDAGTQYPQVIRWAEEKLKECSKFYVNLLPPEQMGNILWLPVKENAVLNQLHQLLDQELERRFQIPQHTFDKAFLFHSTLFMDENTEKLSQMAKKLASLSLPNSLEVNTFLVGISTDGKTDIRIIREISLS